MQHWSDPWYWGLLLLPPLMYGLLIPTLDWLFTALATRLNEWENYRAESHYQNHLILKVFSFRSVNSFISLYYYAFSSNHSLFQLSVQLGSFMIAGQLWNNLIEVVLPWLRRKWVRYWNPAADEVFSAYEQFKLAKYNTFEDYAEMLIQFGYVTLFSMAFPLAPLCALVNNLIELRSDAFKLCHAKQRPIARKAAGIGAWYTVLEMMSIAAVLTNCAHLGITSGQISAYFPSITAAGKLLVVFVFEHIIFGFKLLVGFLVPPVPSWVRQRILAEAEADVSGGKGALEEEEAEGSVSQKFAKLRERWGLPTSPTATAASSSSSSSSASSSSSITVSVRKDA
eukprot:PLAT4453.1.p1 GENE.PLAT4453.1~~PLAT4453.1.p1  ORF type:complete len:397 (-),score=118.11 PLAT4453.1:26-1045(-)